MVHLILGINFGFWVGQLLGFLNFMLCNNIFKIIINFIIYIEGSMNIFIINWYIRVTMSY
jgi:hypothetical protein